MNFWAKAKVSQNPHRRRILTREALSLEGGHVNRMKLFSWEPERPPFHPRRVNPVLVDLYLCILGLVNYCHLCVKEYSDCMSSKTRRSLEKNWKSVLSLHDWFIHVLSDVARNDRISVGTTWLTAATVSLENRYDVTNYALVYFGVLIFYFSTHLPLLMFIDM